MEFIEVSSSNIQGVHYDPNLKTLTVKFKSGVYEYAGVPVDVYTGLLQADSKGKFMNSAVIGKFESKKLSAVK